ncbi:hypothetical protein C8R48DRAFT_776535 [Suillus tomentosus]|nr:hypothetical protein C8R48DRAFT_776535 [Suillus tomentosus]
MFAAGSDTTASAITIMMVAAATHADAQVRTQEGLSNVVGRTRHGPILHYRLCPSTDGFFSTRADSLAAAIGRTDEL